VCVYVCVGNGVCVQCVWYVCVACVYMSVLGADKMHRVFLKLMKKYGSSNVQTFHDEIIITVKKRTKNVT